MMKRIGIVAGIGAALVAVLVLAGSVFAQGGGVSVSDGAAVDGGSDTVVVGSVGVGGVGLGAWTLDISYDNTLLTATDCSADQGGVCNAEFSDNEVRITGASAGGLEGDNVLGGITFTCSGEGESALTIAVSVFADATIGDPQDLTPSVSNGTFTCGEQPTDEPDDTAAPAATALPSTGTGVSAGGSSSSGVSWLIALVAVIGLGVLATGYGVARTRA